MVAAGAFVLVILGTSALLANEFIFELGSVVTLVAAAANLIGLVGVGVSLVRSRSSDDQSGRSPAV
jgi:hypothetical protein